MNQDIYHFLYQRKHRNLTWFLEDILPPLVIAALVLGILTVFAAAALGQEDIGPGIVYYTRTGSYIYVHQGQVAEDSRLETVSYFCDDALKVEQYWNSWHMTLFDQGPPHGTLFRDHEASIFCYSQYVDCEAIGQASTQGRVLVYVPSIYAPCGAPWLSWPIMRVVVGLYEADGTPVLFDGEPACSLNLPRGCGLLSQFEQQFSIPYLWESGPQSSRLRLEAE